MKIYTSLLIILLMLTANFANADVIVHPNDDNQLQKLQQQVKLLQQEMQQLRFDLNQFKQSQRYTSDHFKWIAIKANQTVPKNAVNANVKDAKEIYICHGKFRNLGVHPGRLTPKGCLISYGGSSYTLKNFQILTANQPYSWQPSQQLNIFLSQRPEVFGLQPENAIITKRPIIGGHEKNRVLYICRALSQNTIEVGKAFSGICDTSEHGTEVTHDNYQVLFG